MKHPTLPFWGTTAQSVHAELLASVFRRWALVGLFLAAQATPALGFDIGDHFTMTTKVVLEASSNDQKPTLLSPDESTLHLPYYNFESSLRMTPRYRNHLFALLADGWCLYQTPSNTRVEVTNKDSKAVSILKEALVEVTPHDTLALGAGRSTLKWGPGYYWNPSQPLSDYRENQQESLSVYKKEGHDVAYGEWTLRPLSIGIFHQKKAVLGDIATDTYSDIYSTLVRAQVFLDEVDIAFTTGAVGNTNFSAGSFSSTLSDSLEVHGEVAHYSGSFGLRPRVATVTTADGPHNVYSYAPREGMHPYSDLLVGGGYTFASNTNLIMEYIFNGSGYTVDEFDQFIAQVNAAAAARSDAVLGAAHQGFLQQSSLMTSSMLRQHYVFTRIKFDDLPWRSSLYVQSRLTPEDNSYVAGIGMRSKFFGWGEIGIDYEYFGGDDRSEAGLIPYDSTVTTCISATF